MGTGISKSRNSSVRFSVQVIFAEKKDEEGWKIESRGNGEPNFEELGFQAILWWYWAYLKNLENWFWPIWCFPFHAWDGWSLNWRRWKRPEVVWRSGGRASEAWKEREAQAGGWWTFSTGRKGVSWISNDIAGYIWDAKKKLHALIDAVVFFKNFKFPPDVLWQFPPNLELTGRELPQKAACWILWRQRRLPSCPNQEPPPATTGPAPSFRRVAKGVRKDLRTRDRRNPKRWLWL